MPFYRGPGWPYSIAEVRAILDALAEGRNPQPPAGGAPPPAHTLGRHWALQEAEMKARACAVNGPEIVSCFTDLDTVVKATTEALNSADGTAALQLLDAGHMSANIHHVVAAGLYRAKKVVRTANVVAAAPFGTAVVYRGQSATRLFVRIYRHVQTRGTERLWIQTSFPEEVTPPTPHGAPLPAGGVAI